MDYVLFSLIGGLIFLFTSFFDYYSERKSGEENDMKTASHPREITVGNKPDKSTYPTAKSPNPQPIGYIISVLFQLPLVLSMIGMF